MKLYDWRAKLKGNWQVLVFLFLADALLFFGPAIPLRYVGALLLLCFLPGWALAGLLLKEADWWERLALSFGLSLALSSLATLLLHYLPGPMGRPLALLSYNALVLIPWAFKVRHASCLPPTAYRLPPFLLLALALFFRLTFLGYSEFQGDEVDIMLSAARALEGEDAALFLRSKGPAEALLPVSFWLLNGQINELMSRLPFALAGSFGVVAIYLFGRAAWGERAGLLAGLLLAVNGYFVGFGRIVQYQSLVLLFMGLALLCALRFHAERKAIYLLLSAFLAACGILAHYDASLFLPAFLYLSVRRDAPCTRKQAIPALLLFLFPLALFYIPFLRDPQFYHTYSYLSGSRMGEGLLHLNFGPFFILSTVYNSTYYLTFMILLLIPALAKAALRRSVPLVAVSLWFAVPFFLYIFIVRRPLTHVYTLFPAWALLAGMALDDLAGRLEKAGKLELWAGAVAFCALYLVFAWYIFIAFVGHSPEYINTYPEHKNPFFWTPYEELPPEGYFGFPHRAGWKVVGELYRAGILRGDYSVHESSVITFWYTRRAPRACSQEAEYRLVYTGEDEPPGYGLIGTILTGGEPRLRLYQLLPANLEPATYHLEDYESPFDATMTPDQVAGPPEISRPLNFDLGHEIKFLGYDLDARRAFPGGSLTLTTYWQAIKPAEKSYHVFVHLETERIWSQSDGVPLCDSYPTHHWRPGQAIGDHRRLEIPPETPPGRYPLLVGLYDPDSGVRLDVFDEMGMSQGNFIFLEEVEVRGGGD